MREINDINTINSGYFLKGISQMEQSGVNIPKYYVFTLDIWNHINYEKDTDEISKDIHRLFFNEDQSCLMPLSLSTPEDKFTVVCDLVSKSKSNIKNYKPDFIIEESISGDQVYKSILNMLKTYFSRENIEYMSEIGLNKSDIIFNVIVQEELKELKSGEVITTNTNGTLNEYIILINNPYGEQSKIYYNINDNIISSKEYNDGLKLNKYELDLLIETVRKIDMSSNSYNRIRFYFDYYQNLYMSLMKPIELDTDKQKIILDSSLIPKSYYSTLKPISISFSEHLYSQVLHCFADKTIGFDQELMNLYKPILNNIIDSINGKLYYRLDNFYKIIQLLPFSGFFVKRWIEKFEIMEKTLNKDVININIFSKYRIAYRLLKRFSKLQNSMLMLDGYFYRFEREFINMSYKSSLNDMNHLYKSLYNNVLSLMDVSIINELYLNMNLYRLERRTDKKSVDNCLIEFKQDLESQLIEDKYNNILYKLRQSSNLSIYDLIMMVEDRDSAWKVFGRDSDLVREMESFVESYGDLVYGDSQLEIKTYRTNPELFIYKIKDDLQYSIDTNNQRIKFNHKFNSKDKRISEYIKQAINNKDNLKLKKARMFGMMRQIVKKCGEIHKECGNIQDKYDVFYLNMDEIFENVNYMDVVSERKEKYMKDRNIPYYSRLIFQE